MTTNKRQLREFVFAEVKFVADHFSSVRVYRRAYSLFLPPKEKRIDFANDLPRLLSERDIIDAYIALIIAKAALAANPEIASRSPELANLASQQIYGFAPRDADFWRRDIRSSIPPTWKPIAVDRSHIIAAKSKIECHYLWFC